MKTLFSISLAICGPVCLAAWISSIICMFKTVAHRKPGIRLWHDAPLGFDAPWWLRNPFNHILVAEHLTETGLKYRRWLVISALTFILPIVFVLAFGALIGEVK